MPKTAASSPTTDPTTGPKNPRASSSTVLYEFPEDIANDTADPPAWQDSSKWWMVTPNRDRSVTIRRLEDDWAQAKAKGQGEIIRWASQHLNIEIGLALRSDRWVGADLWQRAADKALTLDALLERSEVVVIGIDGGGLDDLLGLAVLGRDRVTRHWLLWSKAWAHGSVLERRKSEASVLRDFETAGDLRIVANLGDDIAEIAALAELIDESGKLGSVGLDPFGVGAIVDALAEVGIAGNDRVVGITQGWKLTGAIKTAERKLADGTLIHGGTGLMAWAVGNAKVEPKGNAIVITKQASGMRSRQSGTASDHGSMSVHQAAPLGAVARRQRVTFGRLLLAQRLLHSLRCVLGPTGPNLQPEDRGRQTLAGGLTRHGEQILCDLGRSLDAPQLDLVGVVEAQRLGGDADQAGDLVLGDAEARERFHEVAGFVSRHMGGPAGFRAAHWSILHWADVVVERRNQFLDSGRAHWLICGEWSVYSPHIMRRTLDGCGEKQP